MDNYGFNWNDPYTYVYKWIDPYTYVPVYIGASVNPASRRMQHKSRYPCLRFRGDMVLFEAYEDEAIAHARERYWIKTYDELGVPLLNTMHAHIHGGRRSFDSRINSSKLDVMFNIYLWEMEGITSLEDISSDKRLHHLDQFIANFSIRRPLTAKEKSHYEIWCNCELSRIIYPDRHSSL